MKTVGFLIDVDVLFFFLLFIYIIDLFMHLFIYYICRYFGKLISIFPSMIVESSNTANISRVMRTLDLGYSDQAPHKLGCTDTGDG